MTTVSIMTTPQLSAAAPAKLCPLCGRRMQHISTNETTYYYACFQHDSPFYFNYHYAFTDEGGRIREAPDRAEGIRQARIAANYDPMRGKRI